MSDQLSVTSERPGDSSSLDAAVAFALSSAMLDLDKCIPAQVAEDNYRARGDGKVSVQPMIKRTRVDGTTVDRPQLMDIPVLSLGAGGFMVNFPLKKGDLGWIVACDRDISLYLQSVEQKSYGNASSQPAPITRTHSFSDAWFIPDVLRKYVIHGGDEAAMVIQSLDATVRVSLFPDRIEINSPTTALIKAPTNITLDTALVNITKDLNVAGKSTLTGRATMQSGFDSTGGTSSSSVDHLKVGGIPMETHHHNDPQGGVVGPPTA
ncbi:hypothetical protein [Burkholderia phage BCSR129]|nr:hypothetical protein [Burkholderia phage BCSR129]